MQPIDDHHIVTVGRTVDTAGSSLALRLYDVTNISAPVPLAVYPFSGVQNTSSEVEEDHRAFSYYASRGLLAFPVVVRSSDGSGALVRSTLQVFSVDPDTGFTPIGEVDHAGFFTDRSLNTCAGMYGQQVRRGVFLSSTVYSISYGGIVASEIANGAITETGRTQLDLPTAAGFFPCP
jgi:hypothetical protein